MRSNDQMCFLKYRFGGQATIPGLGTLRVLSDLGMTFGLRNTWVL